MSVTSGTWYEANIESIISLLEDEYALDGEITPCSGAHDVNLRIDSAGKSYLLKLMRVDCDPRLVDLQVAALCHLAARANAGTLQEGIHNYSVRPGMPCMGSCHNFLEIGTPTDKARSFLSADGSANVGTIDLVTITGISMLPQHSPAQVEYSTVFIPNQLGLALGLTKRLEGQKAARRKYEDGWRIE